MKKATVVVGLLLGFGLLVSLPVFAQAPGGGGPGNPEMGAPQGGPGGGFGKKGPMDPAEKAKREKMMSLRTTAEAYKSLADLYRQQGKTDEAIAQLKKILDLANQIEDKNDPMIAKQMGHVYMEMAEAYAEKNKFAEAEAILNEGIEKTKNSDAEIGSQLALRLGKVLQKNGKTAEAEKAFQKVIEINAAKLNAK